VKQAIISGKLDPLHGTIYDQSGKLRVPAGSVMSGEERASINWLVKGIEGTTK
jgi:basic membrane protein A